MSELADRVNPIHLALPSAIDGAALIAHGREVAELGDGDALGLGGRRTRRGELAGAHLDVERELALDLPIEARAYETQPVARRFGAAHVCGRRMRVTALAKASHSSVSARRCFRPSAVSA